jgi:type I restriction enzyme M protein
MAVKMLDPGPKDLVLDPACGTGGFLTIAMNHVIEKIRETERDKWRDPDHPTQREHEELFRKIQRYADRGIVGIDINPNLVKAAKMNMVMNNDGSGNILRQDSLLHPHYWEQEFRKGLATAVGIAPETIRNGADLGYFDVIATNPPFGSRLPIVDPGASFVVGIKEGAARPPSVS